MSYVLTISVQFYEGWYHGSGSEPSPARLFQSLVAGAGLAGPLSEEILKSLAWLEQQSPPILASPSVTVGQSVTNYVPNNDLDSKQGDDRRIGEIRTKKQTRPLLFDPKTPFIFAWQLGSDTPDSVLTTLCELADGVFQLGRAVDMAWARADVLSNDELDELLMAFPGPVRWPGQAVGNVDCPTPGSLESLQRRYAASSTRFAIKADHKGQTFTRRPKLRWRKVSYSNERTRKILEIRTVEESDRFVPWSIDRASALTIRIRDAVVSRLTEALSDRVADINRALIGRKRNGENAGPTEARVRIIPLPSIGHSEADMQIRRILIEIPSECPLRTDDVIWSFSGLRVDGPTEGESFDLTLSDDVGQLRHYGVGDRTIRTWRTVTPAALPDATRRRIDPTRKSEEAKSGIERREEHLNAAAAIGQALRHAGVEKHIVSVRVQREPFDLKGTRVEPFAEGTRFSKHCLWHVEFELNAPISGPLLIGNGRFLGLGLMRPIKQSKGIFAFSIDSGLTDDIDPIRLSRALRRAVMARVSTVTNSRKLDSYFSGHFPDGRPARSEKQPHLAFSFDSKRRRLLIVTPELINRREQGQTTEQLTNLEDALQNFTELRAGSCGVLGISPHLIDPDTDPILQSSHVWKSVTPYSVNRHVKRASANRALIEDIIAECERRDLPQPEVRVLSVQARKNVSLSGHLELKFRHIVDGPLLLGRSRFLGGGLFAAEDSRKIFDSSLTSD